MKIELKKSRSEHWRKMGQLFIESVHHIASKDYTQKQLDAWAPEQIDELKWQKIATDEGSWLVLCDEQMAGFAQLKCNCIELLYVHSHFQNMGVGRMLVSKLISVAEEQGYSTIFTEASITARAFFLRCGFIELKEQEVICRGVVMKNYRMQYIARKK